jgi:hypothetical protein
VTRTAAEWLDRQLHFPKWSEASIDKMPVVSIRDWAASVGYPLTKSSAREDRDAGIQALAAHVPKLTATDTDVLKRPAWDLLKSEFVYASWLERANAQARADATKTAQQAGE